MSDINWLPGGPYYEVSLLFRNPPDKLVFLYEVINIIRNSNFQMLIVETPESLDLKVQEWVLGYAADGLTYRSIDLNLLLQIAGKRRSRLYIRELSDQLIKLNFWFNGCEHDDPPSSHIALRNKDKGEFRNFFDLLASTLKPILGTIGYEEDCSIVFDTNEVPPFPAFAIEFLDLSSCQSRMQNEKEIEYGWINGAFFGKDHEIETQNPWRSGEEYWAFPAANGGYSPTP